jgi:predicted membrane-bound spermidine synthase
MCLFDMSCHVLQTPAKRALVVGGGDGGVLRELARHTSLEVSRPWLITMSSVLVYNFKQT